MARTPQQQADEFVAINVAIPVVSGRIIGRGGKGANYVLADRSRHYLGAEACKLLPVGYPRWKLD